VKEDLRESQVGRSKVTSRGRLARKAFTLIELLVVICIITLLMSLTVPVIQKAMARGRETVCRSNLRQFGVLFNLYAVDNKSHLPPYYQATPVLLQYPTQHLVEGGYTESDEALLRLNCPANRYPGWTAWLPNYVYARFASENGLEEGSQKILMADALNHADWGTPRCHWRVFPEDYPLVEIGFDHHPSGANVLFIDGHVEAVYPERYDMEWLTGP